MLDAAIRVHPAATGVSDFRNVFSRPLWIVFDVAAGILLIACANVASLLLARATARATEMAMRVSLGAARTRLLRQLLTESLLLSLFAGAVGWLLARAIAPLLVRMLSTQNDPVQFDLALNSRVLFFSIGVSTLSAVFFGLLPAWQASGTQPMLSLRTSAGQAGKLRLRKAFVSIQVACAFCLILIGGAFLFTLGNLLRVNPGFDARNVVLASISTDAKNKPEPEQRELMFQLQRRLASQPGIQGAALAMWPIFSGGGWSEQILIPGKAPSDREEIFYRVSPNYFSALRTPLLAGRDFTPRDDPKVQPIPAVVNQAFARKYFPGQDPLGKEFGRPNERSSIRHIIVGLAADARYYDLRKSADPIVYLPVEGQSWFSMYVRSPLNAGSVARLIDREAQAISGMRLHEVVTLQQLVGATLRREKLLAGIGGAFAFFGLVLAATGLFGLLSYSVGRRTKEIGIRAALGAQRPEIVALVLKDLGALTGAGLVAGLAGALAIIAGLRSLLFGMGVADPVVIATALALFFVTGLIAIGFPANRAARVDPAIALRYE
jgi:predicted permease